MIAIERKRTERTKEPFLLMLMEARRAEEAGEIKVLLERIAAGLGASSRETDVIGWYQESTILGVIFTGLTLDDRESFLDTALDRVRATFHWDADLEEFKKVEVSFHFFPDEWDHSGPGRPSNPALYPDLNPPAKRKKSLLLVKRAIDVIGSALAIVACSPLLAAVAVAIKMTSKGPVLFRQQRVGQYGKYFTFLKFRSMYVNNDHAVHRQYVTAMIAGDGEKASPGQNSPTVYKIQGDKRVTRVGRFLRRTSLDELPQFFNVLRGEMSLVGPRPAIPYELAAYQTWHRRRVLEAKPGITGVWQVAGRSRVKFDEMVRMDLRYATEWSPWLDVKILLMTPMAVIRGDGAY